MRVRGQLKSSQTNANDLEGRHVMKESSETAGEVSLPLPGRENEFDAVLAYLHRLWSQRRAATSLFVFGACGSGKTSTVLRALRCVADRPIPWDSPSLSVGEGSTAAPSGALKRGREKCEAQEGDSLAWRRRRCENTPIVSSCEGTLASLEVEEEEDDEVLTEDTRAYWVAKYPAITAKKIGAQRILGHYLNCADCTAPQLVESIVRSIKAVCPRMDPSSRQLSDAMSALASTRRGKRPSAATAVWRPEVSRGDVEEEAASLGSLDCSVLVSTPPGPLHVLVLDEVEYVRSSAHTAITEIAAYAARNAHHLALIFISNQRHLVHVPKMMLEELGFGAYTIQQLKAIAQSEVDQALQEALSDETQRERIKLAPSVLEYMARKALTEFSGDARQVISMCRRVVFSAVEAMPPPVSTKKRGKRNRKPLALTVAGMRSVVDAYTPPAGTGPRGGDIIVENDEASGGRMSVSDREQSNISSTRSSTSSEAAIRRSAGEAAAAAAAATTTVSLSSSIEVLRSCVVEDEAERYISSMTEQMAYVLSCLLVLRLQQQAEEQRRRSAVAGVTTKNARQNAAKPKSVSNATSMRELHSLYSLLMSRRHFPAMNPSGIASAVDGLADIGVITRPQRKGNETLFCLNGTWSLPVIEAALTQRGEVLRKEMASCGLDGSENRFGSVLFELKRISGLV